MFYFSFTPKTSNLNEYLKKKVYIRFILLLFFKFKFVQNLISIFFLTYLILSVCEIELFCFLFKLILRLSHLITIFVNQYFIYKELHIIYNTYIYQQYVGIHWLYIQRHFFYYACLKNSVSLLSWKSNYLKILFISFLKVFTVKFKISTPIFSIHIDFIIKNKQKI